VYGILRLTVLNFDNTLNWYAQSNAYTENVLYRIWTFLEVLWVYTRLAFVPVGLHMERNVPVLTAPWQYPAFLGIALLLLAAWWVVRSWRRGNRIPFFGALMFLIPLAPSSGILAPINALIYEHWLYLSMFGFATLFAVYGVRLYDWLRQYSRPLSVVILVVAVCYAMFLGVQTIRRNIIWGNPERLYLQVLQYQPQNVRVLNNLANLYADEGNVADAEQLWLRAVESDPMQPAPYHNLANLERDRGNTERAIELYRKATGVDPRFTYSYQNLAALLLELDRVDEAAPVLAQWQKADPRHPLTYHLLARIFAANGDIEDARAILERGYPAARAAGPDFVAAYDELMSKLK